MRAHARVLERMLSSWCVRVVVVVVLAGWLAWALCIVCVGWCGAQVCVYTGTHVASKSFLTFGQNETDAGKCEQLIKTTKGNRHAYAHTDKHTRAHAVRQVHNL